MTCWQVTAPMLDAAATTPAPRVAAGAPSTPLAFAARSTLPHNRQCYSLHSIVLYECMSVGMWLTAHHVCNDSSSDKGNFNNSTANNTTIKNNVALLLLSHHTYQMNQCYWNVWHPLQQFLRLAVTIFKCQRNLKLSTTKQTTDHKKKNKNKKQLCSYTSFHCERCSAQHSM